MSEFSNSTDREIHGYNFLVGALIFLSVVVGIALLADTAPNMGNRAVAHVAQATITQPAS
jgi:hypothetical protein